MTNNLQGIIRKTTANALVQFEKLGYHSQNFANMNTNAYKTVSFDEVLTVEGYTQKVVRTNTAQGGFRRTNNPLDICIQGAGYVPITSKEGNIYYTRDGSFKVDKDGTLTTTTGEIVGSGIKIGADAVKVEIKNNGGVYTYKTKTSKGDYQGTIPLVMFNNPEGLKEVGGNKYEKTENSGEPILQKEHNKIAQWGVERSNVDVFAQVNDMLRANAQMLAQTKLLSAVDSMYEKSINIRE